MVATPQVHARRAVVTEKTVYDYSWLIEFTNRWPRSSLQVILVDAMYGVGLFPRSALLCSGTVKPGLHYIARC